MRKIFAATLVIVVMLAMPVTALATVGVGVSTGKIEINEQIKAGSIYTLPPITVFNSGTEEASYEMEVTLNETQKQLKPNPAWFTYEPSMFSLQPGKSQSVTIKLHPPVKTPQGDYFAYLEAHPAKTVKQGTTNVGVAAATKLSFTVAPSNIFLGMWYRGVALYRQYEPFSQIATGAIIGGLVLLILNKGVNLKAAILGGWTAGRSHKTKKPKNSPPESEG